MQAGLLPCVVRVVKQTPAITVNTLLSCLSVFVLLSCEPAVRLDVRLSGAVEHVQFALAEYDDRLIALKCMCTLANLAAEPRACLLLCATAVYCVMGVCLWLQATAPTCLRTACWSPC